MAGEAALEGVEVVEEALQEAGSEAEEAEAGRVKFLTDDRARRHPSATPPSGKDTR